MRWAFSKKTTVDECKSISIKWLKDKGFLEGFQRNSMTWKNYLGEQTGSIGFEISINNFDGYIRFYYTHSNYASKEKQECDYKVKLVNTPCYFGGYRWWFVCPLVKNNRPCQRRSGVLYLGGKYFGCRMCHDLTYQSCQDSHRFDRLYLRLAKDTGCHPDFVKEVFNRRNLK